MIVSPVIVLATSVDTSEILVQFRLAIDDAAGFDVPDDEFMVYTAVLSPAASQTLQALDADDLLTFEVTRNVGGEFDGLLQLRVTDVRVAEPLR